MSYIATGVDGQPLTDSQKLDLVLSNQTKESQARKMAFTIGIVGAVIAAARLGIVAVPLIKAAKARPRTGA